VGLPWISNDLIYTHAPYASCDASAKPCSCKPLYSLQITCRAIVTCLKFFNCVWKDTHLECKLCGRDSSHVNLCSHRSCSSNLAMIMYGLKRLSWLKICYISTLGSFSRQRWSIWESLLTGEHCNRRIVILLTLLRYYEIVEINEMKINVFHFPPSFLSAMQEHLICDNGFLSAIWERNISSHFTYTELQYGKVYDKREDITNNKREDIKFHEFYWCIISL